MKRSGVNTLIATASSLFEKNGWALPEWANWSPQNFAAQPDLANYLYDHQMGWDVTDFGCGQFEKRGLVLFCARNGVAGRAGEISYAEKLMMVREGQETPLHFHRSKMEDIINRGGGVLVLEFYGVDAVGKPNHELIALRIDGSLRKLRPGEALKLQPGESVTIPQRIMHRFYAKPGSGSVIAGEVSQCNDDHGDNYFFEDIGRFSAIVEDEAISIPLWNEVNLR